MYNKYPSLNKLYLAIFSIAIIYFLLYTSFYLVCFFDKLGLYKLISQYKTYEYLPFKLDMSEIKLISSELMEYISGKSLFLETKVHINGILTEFYSTRSKIHMADVRNIIVTLTKINYFAILTAIISIFKLINLPNIFTMLKITYSKCLIIICTFLTIIFITAAINFDVFFTKFHEVLFTNDLWLLDPNEDYIICLLPEKIFMTYGIRIIIAMLISIIFLFFLLHILSKIQSRQEAK